MADSKRKHYRKIETFRAHTECKTPAVTSHAHPTALKTETNSLKGTCVAKPFGERGPAPDETEDRRYSKPESGKVQRKDYPER